MIKTACRCLSWLYWFQQVQGSLVCQITESLTVALSQNSNCALLLLLSPPHSSSFFVFLLIGQSEEATPWLCSPSPFNDKFMSLSPSMYTKPGGIVVLVWNFPLPPKKLQNRNFPCSGDSLKGLPPLQAPRHVVHSGHRAYSFTFKFSL